jgi:hypothetical protein
MNNITYVILACNPDKGMKSYGSKGLLEFNKKKLFQHQFEWIRSNSKNKNYEILLICNFDLCRIQKIIDPDIKIFSSVGSNPIYVACSKAKYNKLIFMDYGCLFKPKILNNISSSVESSVLYVNDKKNQQLKIGCIIKDNYVEHIFLDLPDNKFCNIFSISSIDKQKILDNIEYQRFNLLYFEILNMLISSGSLVKSSSINSKDFLYFTQMRQKNDINTFIKKITN